MAAGELTTAQNPETQRVAFLRAMLATVAPRLCVRKYALFSSAPEGEGNVVQWFRGDRLPIVTTPLAELADGTDNKQTFSWTTVSGELLSYGGTTVISEKQRRTMFGPAFQSVNKLVSQNAYETIETIDLTVGLTTTSKYYAVVSSGVLGQGVNNEKQRAIAADFPEMEGIFGAAGAQPFSNGMYTAILHPKQLVHLKNQAGTSNDNITWFKQNQFRPEVLAGGDAGSISNVKLESCGLIPSGVLTSGTCYRGLVLADEGIGTSSLDDGNPNIFINTASQYDTSNPYRNKSTLSWFVDMTVVLLDSNRVIEYASLI